MGICKAVALQDLNPRLTKLEQIVDEGTTALRATEVGQREQLLDGRQTPVVLAAKTELSAGGVRCVVIEPSVVVPLLPGQAGDQIADRAIAIVFMAYYPPRTATMTVIKPSVRLTRTSILIEFIALPATGHSCAATAATMGR